MIRVLVYMSPLAYPAYLLLDHMHFWTLFP
jgi:hypothetical protein